MSGSEEGKTDCQKNIKMCSHMPMNSLEGNIFRAVALKFYCEGLKKSKAEHGFVHIH